MDKKQMHVTLKAEMGRGVFYWVTSVMAASDDEAVVAAENLFLAEVEKSAGWEFTEFEVIEE